MKIAATSDLHGNLPEVEECDILLICGDIFPLWCQSNMIASEEWLLTQFLPWCRDNKAKNVVYIAGNHDFFYERKLAEIQEISLNWRKYNIYYLKNELVEVEGLKIFGTPYCKIFGRWAFMREPEKLQKYYSEIPEGLDILISHDSPKISNYGKILAKTPWNDPSNPIDAGNSWLAEEILKKKPRFSFCGHVHSGDHTLAFINETTEMANVSLVDESYRPTNSILYIDYEK